MTSQQVRSSIQEIGIIPALRVYSAEDAEFAADAVTSGGIPIVEITMTVPGALDVVSKLAQTRPELIVGAGTVLNVQAARDCVAAGASFITSTGLDLEIVEFARDRDVVVFPGVLTPTEIMAAWKAGSDFVKVFPCAQVGGAGYIKALKAPFPHIPLIAAGGVTQKTAADFIHAGATALGIGSDLIPRHAITQRQPDWIRELARRFLAMINRVREEHSKSSPGLEIS